MILLKKSYIIPLICLLCSAIMQSCSSQEATNQCLVQKTLVVIDSIGVEYGDSTQIFGDVNGAFFINDTTLVVLDKAYQLIRSFDASCNHIASESFLGNGPFEYQYAANLSLQDPLFGVFEFEMPPRCVFFDQSIIPVASVTLDETTALMNPCFLGDSAIVGSIGKIFESNGNPCIGIDICTWNTASGLREQTIYSKSLELTSRATGYSLFVSLEHSISATGDSLIFIAPDLQAFDIIVYSSDGIPLDTMSTEHERSVRSTDEIELEVTWRKMRDGNLGDWKPSEYEPGITQLQVQDSLGYLWVCHGSYFEPEFDIYTFDGELAFSCKCEGLPKSEILRFGITDYGYLAYTMYPSDYPRIYIMELIDE